MDFIILNNIGMYKGKRTFNRKVKTASNGQKYVNYNGGRYIVEKFNYKGKDMNFYVVTDSVCLIEKNGKWVFEIE
jgi:hypothetical protein